MRSSAVHTSSFVLAALLASMVADARPLPAPVAGPRIDPLVQQKLAQSAPVDVLVLLDDSAIAAAETATYRGKVALGRLGTSDYAQRMHDRAARLGELKREVLDPTAGDEIAVVRDYSVLPVVHLRLKSLQALQRLESDARVTSVAEDRRNGLFLAESLPLIHQPTAATAGYGGAGTTIAVLDTGVDYANAAFGSCAQPGGTCAVVYAQDFTPYDDGAHDANGHGTNVAGIVLGVAPQARIAALDVFRPDGYGYDSDILAAINWATANKATYNIAAINMSLGGGSYAMPRSPTDAFGVGLQNAVNAGIVVVAASGNDGYVSSISSPAAYSNVVSVGAVYDANLGGVGFSMCTDYTTGADRVTCFSNSASFLTVLAPGAAITAAGSTMYGTSQATPHVAGAAAVLRSAYPADTVASLVTRLQTGPSIVDPRNGIAKPRLDLAQAVGQPASELRFGAASYSVKEGAANVVVTVTRSSTRDTASVYYGTADGTAKAGTDYTAVSGTLNFAVGVGSASVSIPIANDQVLESSETFSVFLSGPLGATLGTPGTATVTIADNGAAASTLQFASATYNVTEGTASVTLTVARSGSTTAAATVQYATVNGTAVGGSDFTVKSGTLSFAAGAASAAIVVPITNDTLYEGDENFAVTLSSPVAATLGSTSKSTVKIVDNDAGATFKVAAVSYAVTEGAASVTLAVTRASNLGATVTVRYATTNGTAVAGSDYTSTSGTLSFGPNVTKGSVVVPILNDSVKEAKEAFTLALSSPTGGTLASPSSASVSITDND